MRRKTSKKSHKKTLIAVLLVLIFGVILTVGILQNLPIPQNPQKVPAAEYFEIFDATVDDARPKFNDSGEIIAYEMYALRYKLRAVKGDAHNVVAKSWAAAPPDEFPLIRQGEYATVEQRTSESAPYLLHETNAEGKYPFTVRLRSDEAEGEIVIYL